MKAAAIIGMNYGDEGKGHITSFLSNENTLNIRFNGGAQAAHAVFLNDGRSHVFHHFGSGSMKGARTLLASHFIVNPIVFTQELYELSPKAALREVFIDPRCRVTTPYDMAINDFRSFYLKKNDTCGIGINETVERSLYRQLKISARNFFELPDKAIKDILKKIKSEYLPFRLNELKLPTDLFFKHFSTVFNRNEEIEAFLKIRELMKKIIVVWPDDSLVEKFLAKDPKRNIVFEGGQGMLLDQHRKELMPYLTRSSTGIRNIAELLKTIRTNINFDIFLVTRTYLSRHGDGPIMNETPLPFEGITEDTNPTNRYQGKMRYGYLNMPWYEKALEETRNALNGNTPSCINEKSINVALTCCDQLGKDDFFIAEDDSNATLKYNINDLPGLKIKSFGRLDTDIQWL